MHPCALLVSMEHVVETRQIVRNALITALVTIVLYGFAFTWGAI